MSCSPLPYAYQHHKPANALGSDVTWCLLADFLGLLPGVLDPRVAGASPKGESASGTSPKGKGLKSSRSLVSFSAALARAEKGPELGALKSLAKGLSSGSA